MNKGLNKILVPIDFSDFSRKALPVAQELARIYKGRISPFHAYDLYSNMDGFHYDVDSFHADGDPATIEQAIKTKLRQFALESVDNGILDDSVAVQDRKPAQAIVEASGRFDMIVMSSHGRTGFMRMLMGSVAEKVLRFGNRPIVIVEDESEFTPFRKILVPTDFSSNSLAALPYAQDIAQATGAEVHLFHALCGDFHSPEQFEQQKQERLAKLHEIAERHLPDLAGNLKCFVAHGADSAHNAIREHIIGQHYNLVVMAAIGRTGLDHLPIGSTTATLIRAVHTTFMVIKP